MWLLKGAWSLLSGGNGIVSSLSDIYHRFKDSADEKERLQAADAKARLDAIVRVRELTAGFWEMRLLTFFIAFPFVVHLNAVGIATTFKLGWSIPAFPKPMNEWEATILLSFFGVQAGLSAVSAVTKAIVNRR